MAVGADSEAACISRVVVDDDRQAFACLVGMHQAAVRRFLRGLCRGNDADADDLAQETFWKAYRHIGGFRGDGSFIGWLLRIAWQLHVDRHRRDHGAIHETWDEHVHAAALVEDDASRQYDLDRLLHLLRSEERAAVLLHCGHGFTHGEIAVMLDMPLGTCMDRGHR
ncbi:MAG TPA: RNA polymerase sigma factor [Oleiagrimonas sp.]|nr:RNA polymerase sigma factor [Oleiagrimonas sp.]